MIRDGLNNEKSGIVQRRLSQSHHGVKGQNKLQQIIAGQEHCGEEVKDLIYNLPPISRKAIKSHFQMFLSKRLFLKISMS